VLWGQQGCQGLGECGRRGLGHGCDLLSGLSLLTQGHHDSWPISISDGLPAS
jgi:hypothetical protein